MTRDRERVANARLDRLQSLRPPGRLEAGACDVPAPAVPVGHLGPVVLVPSGSMGCRRAEASVGGRIAFQLVGNQLPYRSPLPLQELAEEALDGSRVPSAHHQNVEDVAVLVHRSPEAVAFPTDPDEHLVQICLTSPSQPCRRRRLHAYAGASLRHHSRIAPVGHADAAPGEKILNVTEA